jgi:hypothetical protein
MTIDYLIPLHKPSTRHVGTIVYILKSVGSRGYTFSLERLKSRGISRNVFYIETIFRGPDCQRSVKRRGKCKTHFLLHNF